MPSTTQSLTDWHRKVASSIASIPAPCAQPALFLVEGRTFTLDEMLAANKDDPSFCAWARAARPGDSFPALAECVATRPEMVPLLPTAWIVQIKRGAEVVRQFPAMGFYRAHVQRQHEDLADASKGEQCIALTTAEAAARARRAS